uniref:Uncharacterized protein n=1 Tax=Micromonas pusilla TaxID=38833 RepID=A0A7S0GRZ5_MICPS|mmetsp:Transcript_14713/g.63146  ORF Transcript_14713/g.63146 Transcript_14713/m.63146 type:complete len:485 (+) Transcript_14713:174-1628(+)
MGGGFTLEPHRGCKPWAAVVRLTPAMLACLEGQPGRAAITLNATGDATLRVGDNSFTFASIPEDVPGDLIRGSLESESRSLRVAGSLRCRLQPKRALAGTDGLAARVKRRVEEEAGERRARRTMVTEFVAPPDGEKKTKRQRKTTKAGRETRAPKLSSVETKTDAKTDEEPRADDETENENASRPVAAPPARVSERLAQLAGSAAKAASGRAANQLRAAALAILASRPLTFSAVHTAVSSGLASAGIAVPHRSVFEDAVKKLATYRAPGKYHLLDAAKTEGAELLAAAERDVPDQVTTPPLRFPEPPALTRANGPPLLVDDDVAAGLTDDDEELWPDERVGPPAARAAGDAARDGEWERAAEKCVERMHRLGVCETFGVRPGKKAKEKASPSSSSSSYRWAIATDAAFREAKRVYQEHYATYMAMHAALESNAAEYASASRDSRRAFRERRGARYGAMAEAFDALEHELAEVKRAVSAYAEGRR